MTVVKINAITVPDGQGPELEKRFADRQARGGMSDVAGFLGYELLRPVAGETRYFVYTCWKTDADYCNWLAYGRDAAHDNSRPPIGTGADLLEFEVVDLTTASPEDHPA